MKCSACGYEYKDEEESVLLALKEPFVEIRTEHNFVTSVQGSRDNTVNRSVYLYGCPKCKTVIFDAL